MDDATYRRKADKLLRACSNNGNLGHCIGCDKFVVSATPKIPHTKGCPVEELLSAGAEPTLADAIQHFRIGGMCTCDVVGHAPTCAAQAVIPVPPWLCGQAGCGGTSERPCRARRRSPRGRGSCARGRAPVDDATFRRRAHALLTTITESDGQCSDPMCLSTDNTKHVAGCLMAELLAAGPSSGLPVAGCPCETCKAKPATDPDAPVRLYASEDRLDNARRTVMIRPSLIIAASEGCGLHGEVFVRLRIRGSGALYVRRFRDGKPGPDGRWQMGEISSTSPCRAIPEPWRNV